MVVVTELMQSTHAAGSDSDVKYRGPKSPHGTQTLPRRLYARSVVPLHRARTSAGLLGKMGRGAPSEGAVQPENPGKGGGGGSGVRS